MTFSFKKLIKAFLSGTLLYYKGNDRRKVVALTFDDGPFPENTRVILDILRRNGIKATFFMCGENMEMYRDITAEVINHGHEIGSHFYNHRAATKISCRQLDSEMQMWRQSAKSLTGTGNYGLVRPPYGKMDIKTLWYMWRNKWEIILWSVDIPCRKFKDISVEESLRIVDSIPIGSGDIILMHEDSAKLKETLQLVIDKATSAGLLFVKVSDLIRPKKEAR